MIIKPLVRDTSYYQINKTVMPRFSGFSLTYQFDSIVSYINRKLVETTNNLSGKKITTLDTPIGLVLRNIGNNTTLFDRIRQSDIISVGIDKFKTRKGGLLTYQRNEPFIISPSDLPTNQLLFYNGNVWEFLPLARNMFIGSITNTKIAREAVTLRHLVPNIADDINFQFRNIQIVNNTLTVDKFQDGCFTSTKLSAALKALRDNAHLNFPRADWGNLPFVEARHIVSNSVNLKDFFTRDVAAGTLYKVLTRFNLPQGVFYPDYLRNISTHDFFSQCRLALNYIQDNSFQVQNTGLITKQKLHPLLYDKFRQAGVLT